MSERSRPRAVAERFGRNLRRIRRREDLSQERLGRLAGLHRTEIGKLENGERVCRIDTLTKLAGSMAVPPGELLDGIDWVPGPETEGSFTFGGDGLRRRIVSGAATEDGSGHQGTIDGPSINLLHYTLTPYTPSTLALWPLR